MPLIDLKTNLKSLRFGNDRPGNGSSADAKGAFAAFPNGLDPLIPSNENEDQGLQGFTINNDFGTRGGLLRVGAALDDVERLLKLYTKTNVGLTFNAVAVAQGLLADPMQVWNPAATTVQSGLNVPGIGHYPAFFNPSPESFGDFLNPVSIGPTDLRSSTKLKPGESDVYGIGKVAIGTNNLLKGTALGSPIGSRIRRKRGVKDGKELYNIVYDKGNVGNQLEETSDRMAMKPLYNSSTKSPAKDVADSDFIKFRISVVNNDDPSIRTWITFRAFIDSFSDGFSGKYNSTKYVGRGEDFYTYGGFTRKISMGFTVAVQSRQEQFPLYEKLNYLASLTAPDYSEEGFMRGNLVYLTVGDYLVDTPGVLEGISIGGFETAPWEIAKKLDGTPLGDNIAQLPHILKVSGFSFTPIHNFIPQKGSKFIGYDIENPTGLIQPTDNVDSRYFYKDDKWTLSNEASIFSGKKGRSNI